VNRLCAKICRLQRDSPMQQITSIPVETVTLVTETYVLVTTIDFMTATRVSDAKVISVETVTLLTKT